MQVFETPSEMAAWARAVRDRGETIAFVPTMGYLHEGHLSLMREARERGQHLVASIFVNPLQFGANEDLDTYPRDAAGDAAKCRDVGVDVLFTPTKASLYPDGFQTTVQPGPIAGPLCGASRPGHFEGVCTIVLKLFNLVRPNVGVFGRKDYQQLAVLRRMARDFDVDVDVLGMPIVRESDGVAMSSRNARLGADQRTQAQVLHRALDLAESLVAAGERGVEAIVAAAAVLIREQPLADIDYVELVDADDLSTICDLEAPAVLALAVKFGSVRLIDNRVLTP
ncbi:MAG: pantoate--beta-alanine ligase [Proteobacteria bacterium]|nr:pantoate--beta-alanine ligase [Pseudomonadota bacterium]